MKKYEFVNKETGEIITPKTAREYYRLLFDIKVDKTTRTDSKLALTDEQVVQLRTTTRSLTTVQVLAGIGTGIALGQGIFTGTCIALGSAIIYDMITPTDLIYKKVLTFKTEKA